LKSDLIETDKTITPLSINCIWKVKEALRQYEVSNYEMDRVEVANGDATALETFRNALAANEGNGNDYILVHFLQDVVTQAQGGPYPHISTIGACDKNNKRVLVNIFGIA
jgi:hypothetical protein